MVNPQCRVAQLRQEVLVEDHGFIVAAGGQTSLILEALELAPGYSELVVPVIPSQNETATDSLKFFPRLVLTTFIASLSHCGVSAAPHHSR